MYVFLFAEHQACMKNNCRCKSELALDFRIASRTRSRHNSIAGLNIVHLQNLIMKEASIHGGCASSTVPDTVDLQLLIRSYKLEVRDRLMTLV